MLLGDVFEMWLDAFHEVPVSNEERVKQWKHCGNVLIDGVQRLVTDCGVQVFYVRGNHDHEITEDDVNAIFNGLVKFVECTLILRLKVSGVKSHIVRLAHGHEWDVFNSYLLRHSDQLMVNRPIGYFIARAVATSGRGAQDSELEDLLIGLAKGLLNAIPADLEDDLVDVLKTPDNQRDLIAKLFKGAFKVNDLDFLHNAKCRVSDTAYICLRTMLEYPVFRLSSALVSELSRHVS